MTGDAGEDSWDSLGLQGDQTLICLIIESYWFFTYSIDKSFVGCIFANVILLNRIGVY